jgi:hypothetical protein
MPIAPLLSRQKMLLRIHFYLLLFILINALSRWTIHIGFNPALMLIAKIMFFFSGASSFIITVKPFRLISLYFSVYILAPVITCLSFLFGGLLGAIVLSVLILPFYEPVSPTLTSGPYNIDRKYEGFLGAGGNYYVDKNEYLILQKRIGAVYINRSILNSPSFSVQDKTLYLHVVKKTITNIPYKTDSVIVNNKTVYTMEQKQVENLKDTTLVIDIQ